MVKTLNKRYTAFWNPTVKFYPKGVLQSRRSFTPPTRTENQEHSRRGDITTFSRHSSLRLRKSLLALDLPENLNCKLVGLTLTLPWQHWAISDWDSVCADYRSCFHRFSISFLRKFPNSAAIFRHELQVRGLPHCHLVFWLSDFDFHLKTRGRCANVYDLKALIFSLWSQAVICGDLATKYQYNLSGFAGRGVRVDPLSDCLAALRYVCDHTSKHKKAQLGYKGKQWGFLRRSFFVPVKPFEYTFQTDDELICFSRHLSKVCRFRVKSDNPFHSKLSHRSCGKSVTFCAEKTVDLIAKALLDDHTICKAYDIDKVFFDDLETSFCLWLSLGCPAKCFHPLTNWRVNHPDNFCTSHFFSSSLINCLSCRDLFLWFSLLVRYF